MCIAPKILHFKCIFSNTYINKINRGLGQASWNQKIIIYHFFIFSAPIPSTTIITHSSSSAVVPTPAVELSPSTSIAAPSTSYYTLPVVPTPVAKPLPMPTTSTAVVDDMDPTPDVDVGGVEVSIIPSLSPMLFAYDSLCIV